MKITLISIIMVNIKNNNDEKNIKNNHSNEDNVNNNKH